MMLRPLLFLCGLVGAFAYSAGAGTSTVAADFGTIDSGSMPQTKNQNPGPFTVTLDSNTYVGNVKKDITITADVGSSIAGILGYFSDSNNAAQNGKYGYFTAGNNLVQTSWNTLTTGQAFTHADTPTFGNSQSELAVEWEFTTWKTAPALPNSQGSSFEFTATPYYDGTVYWTVQPSADAEPTSQQVVDGQDSTGAAAFASGSMAMDADTEVSVSVEDLEPTTSYNLYVVGTTSNPKDLYFYAYLLEGVRDPSNTLVTFYRMVNTDPTPVMITPDTDPLQSAVLTIPFTTSAATALRPVMWLVALLVVLFARL